MISVEILLDVENNAVGHHSTGEIVGGVVRHRDLVAKKKIAKFFFPGVFVGTSLKFMAREKFPLYGSHARDNIFRVEI